MRARDKWIFALLLVAGLHCVRSTFFDNVSYLDLSLYSQGLERNPFQSRPAMMPVLQLAERSRALEGAAAYMDVQERRQLGRKVPGSGETMTAMKLACLLIGGVSVFGAIVGLSRAGCARLPELWWLPPALLLAILFASFAARSEQAYWYPYDLPHLFLFGSTCLCILSGRLGWMLVFFIVDLPFRETSLYLIPLSLSLVPWRLTRRQGVALALTMAALWLAVRVPIAFHFAHNVSETGGRLPRNLFNLLTPLHLGQIFSALGFLLFPVYAGRRYLQPQARAFLLWTVPCLLVSAYYGIWLETRITIEWSMPFALLAAEEFVAAWALARPQAVPSQVLQPAIALRRRAS